MPQFKESKKTAAARAHAREVEPSFLVHPLTERHDECEVLAFHHSSMRIGNRTRIHALLTGLAAAVSIRPDFEH